MRTAIAIPFLLALALTGCKKKDHDSPSIGPFTGNTTGDPGGTGCDTGCQGPAPKIYSELRLIGFVAWDATAGEIAPYTYQGDDRNSRLEVRLYEESIDSEFCVVAYELDGYNVASDAAANGFVWGVDLPAGDKPSYETCSYQGFDTAAFIGPLVEEIAAWGVHLRMKSGIDPATKTWLDDVYTDDPEYDIDHFTGGDFWIDDDALTTDADSNYWAGYELTPEFDMDPDTASHKLTSSTLVDGNGDLTTGYYVFDQNVYWDFRPE